MTKAAKPSQPTKEQWEAITEKLFSFYNTVDLMIDGYKVQLTLVRISTFNNAVSIYVNGVFKGEWFLNRDEVCEELRRFFPCVEVNRWPVTLTKDMVKILGKREAKKKGYFDKAKKYSTHWTSFRSMKSHLTKNNTNIEWLNENDS